MRKGRVPGKGAVAAALLIPFLPLAANSFGWIFTEVGRQPWIVYGLMPTAIAVSPNNTAPMVFLTMAGFTLLYGALAVVMVGLVVRRVRHGLPEPTADTGFEHEAEPALGLGY
jgi:cytochrome d ubiquinol oxidase subunit I